MNKIITRFSLLVALISVIIFSNNGISVPDTIIRAITIFFVLSFMFGILTILIYKSINKVSLEKDEIKN
ncbi:MAG: hypothetical protein K9J16_02225 [Melioribacteraceae bacterium]|nr:hypothetical protein [Melioribacteraceae bacterium]MCF8355148.1 hypothetical protein [Melioribacteraceae bacterium]MCF8392477.1 hypothetical protein [Melioribacteraceae bacterium]MCF8418388.1 hypothetical protein [Melioribacteraceae bacterium]